MAPFMTSKDFPPTHLSIRLFCYKVLRVLKCYANISTNDVRMSKTTFFFVAKSLSETIKSATRCFRPKFSPGYQWDSKTRTKRQGKQNGFQEEGNNGIF